jgi:cell wall assembly regulator SMI1
MTSIEKAWDRIIQWYASNVPSKQLRLATGATESQIRKLETHIGLQLPKDVRESYLLHNGSDESSIFEYSYYLLSVEEIAQTWTDWKQLVNAGAFAKMVGTPEGPIKNAWWNLKWIPITHNGGGDHDCVDMDPDKGGKAGQVIEFSHESGARKVSGSSFRDWLASFARRLESGEYVYDADGGSLVPVEKES